MDDVEYEHALNRWMAETGIEGHRRVVRRGSTTTLVSKFEPGFAQALIARLEALPELFDEAAIRQRYRDFALTEPGATRAQTWHRAVLAQLQSASILLNLGQGEIAEVAAGLDSVAALLDSVLFSGPTAGSHEPPSEAEAAAYAEALERMDSDSGLFTRTYGVFEGAVVLNHCPGSRFARALFAQAWSITSGRA